ncbi:hypothetical protein [Streptomyces sp. NPDC056244]|uniref:hypothetical protein n=1 Tax=Streptomyces sp. NPDC056244 TaxID=3345762 RepID=UPI0035D9B2EE
MTVPYGTTAGRTTGLRAVRAERFRAYEAATAGRHRTEPYSGSVRPGSGSGPPPPTRIPAPSPAQPWS